MNELMNERIKELKIMKTNILANIRVLAIVVACLTVFGVGNAWGETFNIVATNFGSTYSTSEATFTSGDSYTIGYKNIIKNANGTPTGWATSQIIQMKKNASDHGRLYNKTSIPGLSKIRFWIQAGTTFKIFTGTSMIDATPVSGAQTLGDAAGSETVDYTTYAKGGATSSSTIDLDYYDIDITNGDTYFYITTENIVTAYIYKIQITYSSGYAVTYNNGGHGTAPSNTTASAVTFSAITGVTGYTCTGWKANVAVTNTSTSASISAGTLIPNGTNVTLSGATTFTAQWSANQYTITLNDNTGSGGSGSKTVTYNANTNLTTSVTVPTKAHHDFAGYWTSTDNGATFGTKLVNADGSWVASVANYTDGSKNWIKADNVTLYAKWTEHDLINYRTVCCTELGTIDGEATLTQGGNSVTISGWSDVANVGTYTVKLYKKNGASWDLVSGSTSGGSAGAQGTRTGITSGSKSVTYTGLEVESEYKFTVQAIAGSAAYCDGVETAVTEINDVDVSSTPFKFRYSIYIDNGSNSGWAHHYIEPTGNTDEGSVDIDLSAHVDYYQFKIAGGFSGWWGQGTPQSKIPANTEWTLNGAENVWLNTGAGGSYTFTVDYSSTNPAVTVTFPSADQDAGYVIYYDNSVLNWGSLYYRIGNNSKCSKVDVSLVPGTDKLYKVTTPDFDNMDAWHIANNYGWTGSNSIYRTKTNSDPAESPKAITNSIAFQQYAVTEDITVIPTTTHSTGGDTGDAGNSNCEFYTINTPTSGMLTHNAAITSYSHGTVTVAYTNTSGSAASFTSGNADLAHRCVLTITATPATGYSLSSLQVNSSDFTSGNEHILSADATITAVFTAQTSTVTLQATSATTGSDQTVLATYDASMPLVTTADKTPAVAAISRTGYTFNGWWDATSGGKQYYSHSAGTIASANNWDKTGSQNLFAQWTAKEYTITLDREGGSTGATSATATYDSGTLTGWSAPTKTGYTFGGYWSDDNGTGTLVINSTGVLQNSVQISSDDWTDASGHWIKDGGVTVYAKWTANQYDITYKDQGDVAYSGNATAGVPTGAPTTHTYGSATALVNGVKDGYRFDGWFDNSTCTGDAIESIGATAITANTTYYAKWTKVFNVTWKVIGGTYEKGVVSGNSQVANGEKISACPTAPPDDTLSCSSKFMGWSVTNIPAGSPVNGSSNISALGLFTDRAGSPTITKDTVFYAVFAKQTNSNGYKYIGDDGTLSDGKKYIFVSSKSAGSAYALKASDLSAPNSGNNGTAVSVSVTSNAEGVLVTTVNTDLEFEYVSSGTKLKYEVSGPATRYLFINGDGVGMKSDESRSRYTTDAGLQGWNNKVTTYYVVYYNSTNEKFEKKESADSRVYAFIKQTPEYGDYRVQCDPNIVTVTYNANSGSTSCENDEHDKRTDYTVCSSAPTRDYYTFAGWLCSADSKTYAASATIDDGAIDDNFTLTAQWTPVNYSISYNLNGGTNAADPISAYNVETVSALPTPTKGHDRFDGWYTDDGVWSNQVASITAGMHGNLTLYAKWTSRYEIVFDVYGGSTTTIYRAADENLESAVAGQGSKPSDPDAPSTCSTKAFVGWVESEIDDETDTKPASLTNATGTPTADKHYYATWAIKSGSDIDAVEDNSFTTSGTESYCSMTNGMKDEGDYILKNSVWSTDLSGSQIKIKVYHLSNNSADVLRISLVNSSGTEVVGTDLTTTALGSNSSSAKYSSYVTLTPNSTVTGYKVALKTKNSNGTCVDKVTREVVATYSKYATSCCATKVTLSGGSPEHGTVEFAKSTLQTCDEDKTVKMTITPALGYQLHTYSVATGDGKVATKSMSAEVDLDNNSSDAQEIDLTFAEDANGAYNVTATFTEKSVTGWTFTNHVTSAEITSDPIVVYVNQKVQLDIAYSPEPLLSSHKTRDQYDYTRSDDDTYVKSPNKAGTYFTFEGKASTNGNTTSITLTHKDDSDPATFAKTVNVEVRALPKDKFLDLVHGVEFDDQSASITDAGGVTNGGVTFTYTAPGGDQSEWSSSYATTCEQKKVKLVGWVESEYADACIAADSFPTTDALKADSEHFFAVGATMTASNKTYYAVWAEKE